MKSKIKVSIITVNYKNPLETERCINSFKSQNKKSLSIDYYVVNNSPGDKKSLSLPNRLPGVKVIMSRKNLGFAGGNNLAIKKAIDAGSEYVLLINPDSYVKGKNFIQELLRCKSDITAPKIEYLRNGKLVYDYGGRVDLLFGRNVHIVSETKIMKRTQKDYFSGACLLIKIDVFNSIGLFDDKYFLYFEDADFCLRAKKAGHSLKFCKKATLFHHLSTTTSKLGKKKIRILADSHLRFCKSHLSPMASPFYLAFNLYLRFKSLLP